MELPIEKLHSYDSKNELEQIVDDEDVEDIFQRINYTIENGFQLGNAVDCF